MELTHTCVRCVFLVMVMLTLSTCRRRTRNNKLDFITNADHNEDLSDPDDIENLSNNEEVKWMNELMNECITKTRLFKCIENFTTQNWKFSDKNSDSFHISAPNIDCGYSLEPPRCGGSNEYPQSVLWTEMRKIMYTPVNQSFTI